MKKAIEQIKTDISGDQVKDKIATDLGIQFKSGKCKCWLHSPSADTVMAFDNKNKKYKCFSCNNSYDVFDHYQQHYNLNFLDAIKAIIKDFSLNIYIEENKTVRKANKKPSVYSENVDNVIGYINKRKISKATIDYVGVKSNDGNVVFEYRNERGEHISNKFRPARKLEKKDLKMWFEKDTNINTLFNMDKIDMSKSLTICEGEFDCLSLIEAGIKNSVSVPTGAGSSEWIETNWDFLEQFKDIVLWFDNDEAGKKGIRNVSNRLDNVKVVSMDNCNDINELLFKEGKEAVIEQYKKAEYPSIENITEFDEIEDYNVYEAENIKTGFKKLDSVMYGFVEGTLNVFTGNSGAGKSTLVNQMCILESIQQNNKCFIFSGELTKGNLKYWITHTLANNSDIEMIQREDGTEYPKVSVEAKKKMSKWLKNKLYIYDNDFDFSYTSILSKMEQLAKRYGVKVFVLDNLMTIDLGSNQDKYEAEKIFINALKKFALTYNAIVHLVAHPRKTAKGEIVSKLDIAGSANISNLADYVTTITRVDKTDEEGVKFEHDAIFSIEKNRPTGVQNKNVGLSFDTHRRRFYINNQELNKNFYDNEFVKVQGEF